MSNDDLQDPLPAGEDQPGRGLSRIVDPIADFMRVETSSGIILLIAAAVALIWANIPGHTYEEFWHIHLTLGFGEFAVNESLEAWVNDGLMTIFFFVVGLEIKRELVLGELRDPKTAALPGMAAIGGMVVPALLYFALNTSGEGASGWAIPVATDIAFVLGVIALLSKSIPKGIKLFMLTLAIIDDIGGILIIAIFYSEDLSLVWLIPAIVGCILIVVFTRLKVKYDAVYVIIGIVIWYCALKSGVHPTIAGVAIGLLVPTRPIKGRMVLDDLEHKLAPITSFVIVPIFALANAGVPLGLGSLKAAFTSPIAWGIILGLVVGKTVGVTVFSAGGLRARIGKLTTGMAFKHVAGASMLSGIGFTVSLFIASLSFDAPGQEELLDQAKIGILTASIVAGVLGAFLAILASRGSKPGGDNSEVATNGPDGGELATET